MNYIVCFVTLIYLCLGNVAGSVEEKIEFIDSSVRNRIFTCITQKKTNHQWYHVYPNGSQQQLTYIGNIPKQTNVKTAHFTIQLEAFDNNTEIRYGPNIDAPWYSRPIDYVTKTDSSYYYGTISNVTLKDNKEPAIIKYNETQEVSFKCQEYIDKTNLVIGVINTTSNMIKTFPDTIFNKSQNGTVLFCIYYEVSRKGSESWITRHVAKKTILVYDETVTVPVTDRQDGSEDKDVDIGNQVTTPGTQDANPGTQGAESGKQAADSSKQDANPATQDADSGNKDADSSNQATIMYLSSAVAVVFILLVVSVIYLKRCRKKPKVEVEPKVLYADLDLLRRNEPESLPREGPEEESPYAQIVGELRPQ